MSSGDVSCRHVVDVLTDYLEGALAVEERVALEQHLLLCEGCAIYLEQLRTTIDLTGQLREEDVPPAVMNNLMRMVKES